MTLKSKKIAKVPPRKLTDEEIKIRKRELSQDTSFKSNAMINNYGGMKNFRGKRI